MPQDKKRPIKVEIDPSHIHELIEGSNSNEENSPRLRPEVTRNYPLTEDQPLYVDPIKSVPTENTLNFDQLPLRNTSPIQSAPDMSQIQPRQQEQSIPDRLKGLLSTPPLRSENRPSGLRKFGAAVAGGLTGAAYGPKTGMEVASNIADQPYREKYQDWLTKTGALGKQAELDIERQKAGSSGLSSYASFIRANQAGDPELQGDIEGAKATSRERALQPGRESLEGKRQKGRIALEDIREEREQSLERTRQTGRETLETNRQKGRQKISDEQIASRERIAKDNLIGRDNVARLNRDLKRQMASAATKNQRVPPSQQYLGKVMAENEISKLISNPDEFEALFVEGKDSNNRATYSLKPDSQIDETWRTKYEARKKEINDLLKSIIGTSYNPSKEAQDEENEDDFSVEEIP